MGKQTKALTLLEVVNDNMETIAATVWMIIIGIVLCFAIVHEAKKTPVKNEVKVSEQK